MYRTAWIQATAEVLFKKEREFWSLDCVQIFLTTLGTLFNLHITSLPHLQIPVIYIELNSWGC